jgi:DNA-binding response OmpR family regulator
VFTVELPRQVVDTEAPPVVQAATQTTPSAQIAGHARIWVVDDDPHARELVRRNLTREGFEVLEAADGATGIARAKELKPDVILLDVMMPGRDGWSTLAALKADPELAHTPVIMSTMLENRELSFAMGAADYMRKPVDWSRLEAMIRRHSPAETRPVLVVEDDPASREMLVRLVQKAGHTAIEARDGREALEILAKQRPQLVLLDLMMPHVDGFDFVERLRSSELGSGIPVLVVTAKSLTPDDLERLTGKVDDVLRKGAFRADELVSRIRTLVNPVK